MVENLQDGLYQLENKQENGAKLSKNSPKFFSKYLKNRICKIKQYLDHILMLIN